MPDGPISQIVQAGSSERQLFMIVSGMVQVRIRRSGDEEEPIVVQLLGEGEIFGTPAFALGLPEMQHVAYTDVELRRCRMERGEEDIQGDKARRAILGFPADEESLFFQVRRCESWA
eukprot:3255804-Rhodomonas_salina.1